PAPVLSRPALRTLFRSGGSNRSAGQYRGCWLSTDAGGGVGIQRQPQPVQRLGRAAGDAGGVRLQDPQQGVQLLSQLQRGGQLRADRKSTRLNSSHVKIS